METYVKVKPDSKQFKVEKKDFYVIHLEQPAENGKANQELVNRLKSILGKKPGIVSGHKSRRKKIKVEISEEEFKDKMKEIING